MQAKNLAGMTLAEPQVKPIKKSCRKQAVSFGMWKDREDIVGASEYVRSLRF